MDKLIIDIHSILKNKLPSRYSSFHNTRPYRIWQLLSLLTKITKELRSLLIVIEELLGIIISCLLCLLHSSLCYFRINLISLLHDVVKLIHTSYALYIKRKFV